MTPQETMQEAKRICSLRGFDSLKTWARENRRAASLHRRNRKPELADALDAEYDRYLRGRA